MKSRLLARAAIGICASQIAEQHMGRAHGLLASLDVGIVGACLGAFLAAALGVSFAGSWNSLLVSTVGAIVLLALVGMLQPRWML